MDDKQALYKALTERLIKEGEGFRENQYMDTTGHRTIGYGYNVDEPRVRKLLGANTQHIPQEVADRLLPQLIGTAENDARAYMGSGFDQLSPERRAVLVDMSYNLGGNKLRGFHDMQAALNAGDWKRAGAEMMDSNYAKQTKGRAVRNSDLMAGRTMARFKRNDA